MIRWIITIFFSSIWLLVAVSVSSAQRQTTTSGIDSLSTLLETNLPDHQRVTTYLALADLYLSSQPDLAEFYSRKAQTLSERTHDTRGTVQSYLSLGRLAVRQSDHRTAIHQYRLAEEAAVSLDDHQLLIKAKLGVGKSLFLLSENDSAIGYLQETVDLALSAGDWKVVGLAFNTLGAVSKRTNKYDTAMSYYAEARDAFERIDYWQGVAGIYNNMGDLYAKLQQPRQAIEQFEQSLDIFRKQDDSNGIGLSLYNIGNRYVDLGGYEQGLSYLREALVIREKTGTEEDKLYCYLTIGYAYGKQGQHAEAIIYLENALSLATETSRKDLALSGNQCLAEIYDTLKATQKAEEHYQQALTLAEALDDAQGKMLLLKDMAAFHERIGNHRAALIEFKRYHAIGDSSFTQEKAATLAELQTKYETSEKERKISSLQQKELQHTTQLARNQRDRVVLIAGLLILLVIGVVYFYRYRTKHRANQILGEKNVVIASQNTELQAGQAQLALSLQEKELLLKEIHHRVKNNLQVISSLLAVQAQQYDHPGIDEFVTNGRARVQAMALVHQFLYQGEYARIAYDEYLKRLTSSIIDFHRVDDCISFRVDAEPIHFDVDTAIPLGLISNEIITNALKHAFVAGQLGHINVSLHQRQGEVVLAVVDNGRGFSSDDLKRHNSFGMSLVQNLARKISGKLRIENELGTRVTLTFQNNLSWSA